MVDLFIQALAKNVVPDGTTEKTREPDDKLFGLMYNQSIIPTTLALGEEGTSPKPDPAMLLGKIMDLSNNLLMDPYHHLIEIPELGKALAEYTHTEYNLEKVDKLFDFFLRDKSDLNGNGKVDYNDVLALWSNCSTGGIITTLALGEEGTSPKP